MNLKIFYNIFIIAIIAYVVFEGIVFVLDSNFKGILLSLVTIFLIAGGHYLPRFFRKKESLVVNSSVIIFIFLSVFIGSTKGFYDFFSWWDYFLHFLSGIIISAIGFYYFSWINKRKWIVFLFVFCFSLTLGVVWEFFEFFYDLILGTNSQKNLTETMTDLISAFIGTIVVFFWKWFRYLSS